MIFINHKYDLPNLDLCGLMWLRRGTGGGCCEHGNELSLFYKIRGIS
jgi:hypothetical protein